MGHTADDADVLHVGGLYSFPYYVISDDEVKSKYTLDSQCALCQCNHRGVMAFNDIITFATEDHTI